MKKAKLAAGVLSGMIMLAGSFPVFAAPQKMADGGIFDAEYYAQKNPDVTAALGTDAETLYQHYKNNGAGEGRLPYDPAEEYQAQYAAGLIDEIPDSIHARSGYDYILRFPNDVVRQHMADEFRAFLSNPNITYSQDTDRTSFFDAYKAAGFQAAAVTEGAADCSSAVMAIVIGAGYTYGIPELQNLYAGHWTGSMLAPLSRAGFQVIDCKGITYDDAKEGDILLDVDQHTQFFFAPENRPAYGGWFYTSQGMPDLPGGKSIVAWQYSGSAGWSYIDSDGNVVHVSDDDPRIPWYALSFY